MIVRNLMVAIVFAALSGGAAVAQATQPAPATPPKATNAAPAIAPKAAEPAKPAANAPEPAKPTAGAPAKAATGAKINLNAATAEQLDGLPQIGPARAKAIVEARAKGKFKSWDDFVARKVVPANAEKAIKDLVGF